MERTQVDLLVIGAGINGAGIAADAAGRGLSVFICDQDDPSGATSSATSKLIHGGLRYLEHMAFPLVQESLREREILLKIAPHLVHPIRFIMPHNKRLRSFWLLRLGLFLYDHLGGRTSLPKSKSIRLSDDTQENPISRAYPRGFIYSDCVVDDARLVMSNLIRAHELGAQILPRTKLMKAEREQGLWCATLQDLKSQKNFQIKAKALINATGPWINETLQQNLLQTSPYEIKKVKGSHIVVPKLYEGNHAYLLQHKDRRVIFVIPFQKNFHMVGTTDIQFEGDPKESSCSLSETEYLCDLVSTYFHHPIRISQVHHTWSGVRPLVNFKHSHLSSMSREYILDLQEGKDHQAPLLNVFGGKLTTYRHLGEEAMALLNPYFPNMTSNWTASKPLPGGDMPSDYEVQLKEAYPFIPKQVLERYINAYGSRAYSHLLNGVKSLNELGENFGYGLYEKELNYLIEEEWAMSVEDILWRRTKLGLIFSQDAIQNLEAAMNRLYANYKHKHAS